MGIATLSRGLADRARAGQHIVLWGPRGSGKSTLLGAIERRIGSTPSARTDRTATLEDVTGALERAYPRTPTRGVPRKVARVRLWVAADRDPAVLLLDHATGIGTAMKGWLRRLRGGIAGIVLAVDVDSSRERAALRRFRLGSAAVRIPRLSSPLAATLRRREWAEQRLPELPTVVARALLRGAQGRPGWIVLCSSLAADPRYWRAGALSSAILRTDTEMALRGAPFGGGRGAAD